jgi:hypothetical protein
VKFNDSDIPIDAAPDAFMPFSADLCAFGEPNDTPAAAFAIAAGDSGPAAICPNADGTVSDVDYYKLTVPDMTASVTVAITFDVTPKGDLDIILFDATGSTMLAESRGFGAGESITCPGTSPACAALAAGDYVLEVLPGVANNFNQYSVSLTIMPM